MDDHKSWLLCPKCNGKTRIMIRKDSVLKNFLLFCPKCKQEHVVDVENNKVTIK